MVASIPAGVTIVTNNVVDNAGALDYECEIVQTNRVYDNDGEDTLGLGFFILEITVEQVVYVTATAPLFTTADIVAIVETGFNRGSGGRVRFRALLREADAFSSVLNVEVLEGELSSPQAAPSPMPSVFPTAVPSAIPSLEPSSVQSGVPSFVPTRGPSIGPTQTPSGTPTQAPTGTPSLQPTFVASQSPSLAPTSVASQSPSLTPTAKSTPGPTRFPTLPPVSSPDDKDRQPLILGAIAGGVATILVACFSIFCVSFSFCGRKTGHQGEDSSSRNRRSSSQPLALTEGQLAATFIPDMVQLDDENQSLANTTLGDQTAGGAFAFGSQLPPNKKRLGDGGGIHMLDSFDENSLYTSPHLVPGTAADRNATSVFSASPSEPPSLSRNLDFEEDLIFPMSESNTDSSTEGNTQYGSRVTTRSFPVDVDGSFPVDVDSGQFVDKDESEEDSSDSDSSFAGAQTDESDDGSEESSLSEQFATRKIFDPFEDGTSGSSSSSNCEDDTRDDPASVGEPETAVAGPSGHESNRIPRSPESRANNSLLRNVLEDAQLLAASQSPSSRSRLSRKSAPSRLLSKNPKQISPPLDLLADNYMLEGRNSIASRGSHWSAKSSTRSVGAAPRSSTMKPREDRRVDFEKPVATTDIQSYPPYRTRFLGRTAVMAAHHYIPTTKYDTGKEVVAPSPSRSATGPFDKEHEAEPSTPASSEPSSTEEGWTGTLGAQPRDELWETMSGEMKLPDTPESSPGILGISDPPTKKAILLDDASSDSSGFSNPWLFDALEQTLGPRSPTADMESISGRSTRSVNSQTSNRSGKSYKSSHSDRSHKSSASTRSRSSRDTFRSHRSASSPRTDTSEIVRRAGKPPFSMPSTAASLRNGSVGEQKSDSGETPIVPRTLENDLRRLDLKRLEMRLSDVLQSETGKIAASAITVSSAGASTLSSKHHLAKKSKKKRVVVVVPPGKLGVVLTNRHNGKGIVVSEVRASSSLSGMLSPGDRLGKCALEIYKHP
jgi:hypothetical protein